MPSSPTAPAKKVRRQRRPTSSALRKRGSGPSFAAGMKPFIGMVKNAPPDLSMREGFGN
ncbi:MAG: hypothetical protein NTZ29_01240 [Verrucomicrobia bacterium]|jgi:hypothetical protein|nr:hypothetical protein [Verrucomicrobiota bacterium]